MTGLRHQIQLSTCTLDIDRDPIRLPPRPAAIRGPSYEDDFDFTTLFCDAFWDASGEKVVLIGPPLFNLAADLRFRALPSGSDCAALHERKYWMDQVTLTPQPGTTGLEIRVGSVAFSVAIQPNLCHLFAGRRAIFTLSRDNDPQWIRDWVRFHVEVHGCDAVLLYDNQSQRYSTAELAALIEDAGAGLPCVVLTWPLPYGVFDGRHDLTFNIYDSFYSQAVLLEHARRRFLATAAGAVNTDTDELALCGGRRLFDVLAESETGYLNYGGWWILNRPERSGVPRRHRDFVQRRIDRPDSVETKWAIDPRRCHDGMQWWVHWVSGAATDLRSREVAIRHFKAINTNWDIDAHLRPGMRTDEPALDDDQVAIDAELRAVMAEVFDGDDRPPIPAPEQTGEMAAFGHARRSRAREAQGSLDGALGELDAALAGAPDHPGFHERRARLHAAAGHGAEATRAAATTAAIRAADAHYQFQMGRAAIARWQADAGEAHLRRAIAIDPDFAEAYVVLHDHLQSAGREAEALVLASQFGERAPATLFGQQIAAKLRFAGCDFRASIAHARQALAMGGGWVPHQTLSLALFGLGDHAAAIAEQRDAIARALRAPLLRPTPMLVEGQRLPELEMRVPFELLWARLGTFHRSAGDLAAAADAAQRSIDANPFYYAGHILLAEVRSDQGRGSDAAELSAIAIRQVEAMAARAVRPQLAPRDYAKADLENRLETADVLRRAGRTEAAAALARDIVARPTPLLRFPIAAAGLLSTLGETAAAEAAIEGLADRVAGNWQLEWTAAQVEHRAGRAAKAIAHAQTAVALNPGFTAMREMLADMLIQSGDGAAALSHLATSLAADPVNARLHHAISLALHRCGRSEAALEPARTAVALQPGNAAWQLHLGALLHALGQIQEARDPLAAAVDGDAGLADGHLLLSHVHNALGDLAAATAAAERAVELRPENAEWLRHLGALLYLSGRHHAALDPLRRCLDNDPGNAAALELLSQSLFHCGDVAAAVAAAERAATLDPRYQPLLQHLRAAAGGLVPE